jgi:hypothetical protein
MDLKQLQTLINMSDVNVISIEYIKRQIIGYTDIEIRRMKIDSILNKIESNQNEQKQSILL